MADFPSFTDLERIGQTEALVRNPRLSLEEIRRTGSDLNILVASAAAMGDEVTGQLASLRADLFVGTARGAALDRLVTDRYPDLLRKQASPSFGYEFFLFSPAVVSAFTIPEGVVLSTADGVQFITSTSTSVPIGTTSIRVPIRSVLAGSSQKASIGRIVNLTSTIAGAPATGMTVNNTSATFGGEDREEDRDYAIRYRLHYLAARRATIGAIEQAILSIAGIVKATVFENLDVLGRPIGYVQAVVADSYTEQFVTSSVTPATYASQLSNMRNQIDSLLREWRAAGVGVAVTFAQVVIQPIRLSLSYVAGADEEAVRAIVLTTLIQMVNNLPPGGILSLASIRDALRVVSGLYYTGGEILSPLGDVVPLPGQALRTSTTFCTTVS
jgi:uncharacterized phage protein gp47/JayE